MTKGWHSLKNSKSDAKTHGSTTPVAVSGSYLNLLDMPQADSFPEDLLLLKYWATDGRAYFHLQSIQTESSITGSWDDLLKMAHALVTLDGSDSLDQAEGTD